MPLSSMGEVAPVILWFSLAIVLYSILRFKKVLGTSSLPLPPGPKGFPLIGNWLDIPTQSTWLAYHKWCQEFKTDILYLNLAGTPLIVLGSYEAANDLLTKRSSAFSDRQHSTMLMELMGFDWAFGFMGYGQALATVLSALHQIVISFRDKMVKILIEDDTKSLTRYTRQKRRRLMDQYLSASTAAQLFHPHVLKASRSSLNRFLDLPDDVLGNLRQGRMAGEAILSIAYGLPVQDREDPYIAVAEEVVNAALAGLLPGRFLVDNISILKHVPSWFPGAGFQKMAKTIKSLGRDMLELPYAASKRNMAPGFYPPCFTFDCLEKLANDKDNAPFDEEMIKSVAAAMYMGGSEAPVAAIASCVLGLLENPEVIQKAQDELNRVVKPGQLPVLEDEASLPYITAIVKETLRWRDVNPLISPRLLTSDQEYKGYRLPAGSLVVANGWSVLHDAERYPDPFEFNPDRFMTKDGSLDPSVWDPERSCWGFGRRICPGRYMAYATVWINVASMLAVFDIKKAVDRNGKVVELTHEYVDGLLRVPKPFQCSITPRSEEAVRIIRATSEHGLFSQ